MSKTENNLTERELRFASSSHPSSEQHFSGIGCGSVWCVAVFAILKSVCVGGDSQRQVLMTDASVRRLHKV